MMGLISVSGSSDARPTVDVHTPLHAATTQFADAIRGTGTIPITSDAQMVVLDVDLVSATTGKQIVSTQYSGDLSQVFAVSRWAQQFPAFTKALHCATAGTRVAIAIAPGGVQASSMQSLGLAADDSLVAVVDVRQVYLAAADGAPVYNEGFGMPAVVRAPGGRPGLVVPDGAAPQSLRVELLERGSGPTVTSSDSVLLHYTIVNWTDKTVADTTWDGEPQIVTLAQKSKGFQKAVVGQRVGSQVMAIIPKADGSSDAKDTQVVVIDILGVVPAGTTQQ